MGDGIGDPVHQLQIARNLQGNGVDFTIDATGIAEGYLAIDQSWRGIDTRPTIDLLDQGHLFEVDDIEVAVTGAAENPAMRDKRRRIAKIIGFEFLNQFACFSLYDVNIAIEGCGDGEAALQVDRRRIFD